MTLRCSTAARRWFSVVVLATMVAGCASTKQDAVTLPVHAAQWQGQTGSAAVTAQWWQQFQDPVLTRLVEEALEHNTDLRLASARVDESKALLRVQQASELPTLDAGGAVARSDSISPVSRRPFYSGSYQEQFQAAYEIDVWGRLRALSQSANAKLVAAQSTHDAVSLSIAANTAQTYISLRALDERLALARKTLVSRQDALEFARARLDSGYTSRLELAQAESELHVTAQAVPQLELSVARTEHALCVLLGRAPGAVQRGLTLDELTLPPLPDAGVPSELMRRRPDVAAVEAQVVASDAQLAASRAQLLPSVRLSAAWGAVGSTIYFGDPFKVWSFGSSILAPLFEGGRLRAQVDVGRSQRDQALISYEKTVLSAFSEVEDQLSAISLIQRQDAELDAQHVSTAEALRIAQDRYGAGYATYLEELDAQRSLFGVEQQSVQSRADLLVANVNLYKALGGGWH